MTKGIYLALLVAGFCSSLAFAVNDGAPLRHPNMSSVLQAEEAAPSAAIPAAEKPAKQANFEQESASQDARHIADWVVDSSDNRNMPFVIIDKTQAKVFLFNAEGRLQGAAPALLGLARGDDSVPGIGDRPLSSMRSDERTTPAGRFVAEMGRSVHGQEILWVDYAAAISLHRVITSNPKEHRAQRLATPTPLDNRISFGCINVPASFFDDVVLPAFKGTKGIVYILPETRSPRKVFAAYDLYESAREQKLSLLHR